MFDIFLGPTDGLIPCCDVMNTECILDTVEFSCSIKCNDSFGQIERKSIKWTRWFAPTVFKRLKHCIAEPLAMLHTQFLSVAAVPAEWTGAIITPVFNNGPAGNVCNYRPISLTCVPSKVMERVIAQQISDHLMSNNILHHAQHGFCKGRSTTNLLESLNDWTLSIQYKHSVKTAYVDFSKAFDTVSHNKSFMRLASYGIAGSLLQWLQQFFL